jgi:hypothetical protein
MNYANQRHEPQAWRLAGANTVVGDSGAALISDTRITVPSK